MRWRCSCSRAPRGRRSIPAAAAASTAGSKAGRSTGAELQLPLGASARPRAGTTAATAIRRARSRRPRPSSLNLLTLFKSHGDLAVAGLHGRASGGAATLHLDRQFASGSLGRPGAGGHLRREADRPHRGIGARKPLDETIAAASDFVGKDGAVTVVAGHTYAISIETETSSSVVGHRPARRHHQHPLRQRLGLRRRGRRRRRPRWRRGRGEVAATASPTGGCSRRPRAAWSARGAERQAPLRQGTLPGKRRSQPAGSPSRACCKSARPRPPSAWQDRQGQDQASRPQGEAEGQGKGGASASVCSSSRRSRPARPRRPSTSA